MQCVTRNALLRSCRPALAFGDASARRLVCALGSKSREALLQWVAPDNRQEVARIVEIAERAAERWEVSWTDFLSPPVVADAMSALNQMSEVTAVAWGGYTQAERCRWARAQAAVRAVVLRHSDLASAVATRSRGLQKHHSASKHVVAP